LAVFAAALALGGGTARATVGGPTCNVPADYATIQAAVNVATCSTINVAAGAYGENVSIARTLTLKGAQAGNPVASRTFGSLTTESTITGVALATGAPVIQVNAASVTIDGFSITNPATLFSSTGIDVKVGGDGTVITNDIIDGITTADTTGNGTAQAVYLENGPDNVTVRANEMGNIHSNRSAKGVLIGSNGGTNPSDNAVIADNSIHDVTSDTRGAYGVSVANIVGGTAGLQILNNTIAKLNGPGANGWVHAIGLEGGTPGVVVTGNSISNLSGPTHSIAVWFENEDTSFATGHVNNNNLAVGSSNYGMAVDPALTGTVDGTCNWWGAANGPGPVGSGSGSLVSLQVTFSPWLTSAAPSACNGAMVTSKDQCKDDGWKTHFAADGSSFKNQGDCIQYVNTGK
jgi:hypothetical protein